MKNVSKPITKPLEMIELIDNGTVKECTKKVLRLKEKFDQITSFAKTFGSTTDIVKICGFREMNSGNTHHYKSVFKMCYGRANTNIVMSFCKTVVSLITQLHIPFEHTALLTKFDIQIPDITDTKKIDLTVTMRSYTTGEKSILVNIELEYNDGRGMVQKIGIATYEM